MNIKSLLLGSAAALVAVSGAKAADAVVVTADPEPVEYVRVCDAYGAGYYYIPGTETCMRISGYVRADISGGDNVAARNRSEIDRDTYAWRTRATLRFHTASETELGTLRTFIELRSQWQGGGASGEYSSWEAKDQTQLRYAYIELGGLRVGMDETIFNHWTNYYGNVLNDDFNSPTLHARTNVISYTFNAGNGFSAILGVEQGSENDIDSSGFRESRYWDANTGTYGYNYKTRSFGGQIDDYAPHVVGGLKFSQGWGTLSAVAAYDARNEEWAGKIRADINVTDQFSVWVMGGYKSMDDYYNGLGVEDENGNLIPVVSRNGNYLIQRAITSAYGDWGGDWAVWGGGTYKFTPKTSFNFQVAYDDSRTFGASVNVSHVIVPGLTITPELSYTKWDNNYGYNSIFNNAGVLQEYGLRDSLRGQDAFQGMVRLQRSF